MIKYLLGRTSTGKWRVYTVEWDQVWYEEVKGYIIQRSYGQLGGKITMSPPIIVDKTKQKRTWEEQCILQFNHVVKELLDKGYKELPKHPKNYTEDELLSFFGEVKTDQNGIIKPQLAKQADKVTNKKIFDNIWMISRKLDGIKALFYYHNGEVHAVSRGGDTLDYSTSHLRENPKLVDFFVRNPTVILDGELFKRGKSLQSISGAARMEKNAYDCDWLEYWVYDCYITDKPDYTAHERYGFLLGGFPFPLYKGDDSINQPIKHLEQKSVQGWNSMMEEHNQYVADGFEGAVIKDPKKPYKPGSRGNQLIKIKMYQAEDFEVIDYELGTRGSEDMVFVCQLEDGRTFKAMPVGDRDVKEEYVKNFNEKYKGHKAECTFFTYSDDGIPTQPKLRHFRFDLE